MFHRVLHPVFPIAVRLQKGFRQFKHSGAPCSISCSGVFLAHRLIPDVFNLAKIEYERSLKALPLCQFTGSFAIPLKPWCDMTRNRQYAVAKSQCLEHLRKSISSFGKRDGDIYSNACKRADFEPGSRRQATR